MGYSGLQEVAGGNKRLQNVRGVTRGYRGLQGVTGGYKWLQEVTAGYNSQVAKGSDLYRADKSTKLCVVVA